MKLYRHYKNKPYKLIAIAKHSETLDDLVVYDCLYDNPTAKTWVRPKELFFGNVEIEGKTVPRFAQVQLKIVASDQITEPLIQTIAPIIEKSLGCLDPELFQSTLENHRRFHLVIAYVDEKAVGFKLGYEDDKSCFYSWLGAVLPEYRGLGIAPTLMQTQHDWCRKESYQKIRTKTRNRYKEMLILNLKFGFEIIGTHLSDSSGLKIILEKRL